jgi:hypothetical protein
MNRRMMKTELLTTLEKSDLEKIFRFLDNYSPHILLNPLFIALCNSLERVRWHAVCGFGRIVPAMADEDPESARIVMRRLLWSLNDESGGIGWGAPEAMAEIMCHCTLLRQEYMHMLVSYLREDGEGILEDGNFLELPLLQRGLLWGIGRLCQGHRLEMITRQLDDDIIAYLSSPDHQVVGLAIWCLGMLRGSFATGKIASFLDHAGEVHLFVDSTLKTITVGKLAEDALKQIIAGEGRESIKGESDRIDLKTRS